MTPIKTQFTRDGFDHRQIERQGKYAIYWRKKPEHRVEHYEVIEIQKGHDREIAGRFIAAAEHYPSSEQWGTYGWTYDDLAEAQRRLRWLVGGKHADFKDFR